MKILIFTGYYLPGFKGGGPIKTIKNLFDTTGGVVTYKLVTSDRDLGDNASYSSVRVGEWNRVGCADVFYTQSGQSGFSQIKGIIRNDEFDLIYLNSFFSFRYSIFPRVLSKLYKKKVVLAPRGEFSVGALQQNKFKKNIFIFLFKLMGLHKNILLQASTEFEVLDIKRTLGQNVNTIIAENIGSQNFPSTIFFQKKINLRCVFLSRISPKKNLLQAITMLWKVKSAMVFDIYGPIEDSEYWAKCEQAITSLPPHIVVKYRGALVPDQVVNRLSEYDLFYFPSLGENYGHVIAEALCAGLPVLLADTTPWRDLEAKGIGWDLPLNEPGRFSEVIDAFADLSDSDYKEMREHVLAWAKNKFSQRDAIEANLAMFKYAINK